MSGKLPDTTGWQPVLPQKFVRLRDRKQRERTALFLSHGRSQCNAHA